MPQIINTNISSLNAQRNLNTSQSALATSLQRLSSGLRINSAKDDAAGMAIADRMTTQIRGLNQASRNANDAISLSQTAEGAMNTIGDNLQRIRELAVQSLNATNSASDRNALDAEVQQLTLEIDRVATQTAFNGVKLLDGTFDSQTFQVGANAGETISIDKITSLRTAALGSGMSSTTDSAATAQLTDAAISINGVDIGASVAGSTALGQSGASAWSVAKAINAVSGHNVTATANATTMTGGVPAAAGDIAANTFQINGVNVGAITAGGDEVEQGANVAAAINKISASTGVSASVAADGAVTLTNSAGGDIWVGGTDTNTGLTATATSAGATHGTVTLTSTSADGITIVGTGGGFAASDSVAASETGTSVATLSVKDQTSAKAVLASVDAALTTLNSARGAMGAYQNRFASTVANLATTSENVTAARSRIQDADFAAETAQLTRNQILQQAGTAMLSQANSLPQNVLSLLQ